MSEQDKESKGKIIIEKFRGKLKKEPLLIFAIIYLPIMFMLFSGILSPSSDLLTDDQKLERQAEIKLNKEIKEKEWQQTKSDYQETIDTVVKEAPFPINFVVGGFVLLVFFKGFGSMETRGLFRHRRIDWFEILTPNLIIPIIVGFFYVMWLSGDLDMIGMVNYE